MRVDTTMTGDGKERTRRRNPPSLSLAASTRSGFEITLMFDIQITLKWQLDGDASGGMYQHDFSQGYAVYQLYSPRMGARIQLLQNRGRRELPLIHGLPRLSPTASEKHSFMPGCSKRSIYEPHNQELKR